MDSYVDVKVNEALYDMKEVLHSVEEQFTWVVREKEEMEKILKEKVQYIRVRDECFMIKKLFIINLGTNNEGLQT
jgi:hypothetical protein